MKAEAIYKCRYCGEHVHRAGFEASVPVQDSSTVLVTPVPPASIWHKCYTRSQLILPFYGICDFVGIYEVIEKEGENGSDGK